MIEDKERAKRLNEVYRYLYANKGVVSQTLFASQIGVQRSALSAAMNGNKLYLTNNLFMKVCAAYPDTFDLDYLLTGEGSLLVEEGGAKVQDTDSGELSALRSRVQILEEQVARQRQIIDHYESFVELLTRENRQLEQTIDNPFVSDKTPASAYDPPTQK
jgi:transcriptional regulator with XRE-family HTH domain